MENGRTIEPDGKYTVINEKVDCFIPDGHIGSLSIKDAAHFKDQKNYSKKF